MNIDIETEATMSDITAPRYGYAPSAAFATTRAGAERRAHQTATAAAAQPRHPALRLLRRLATRLG